MRNIITNFRTFLMVIAAILPLSVFAFHPNDGFKSGKIELKDGQVLSGEVLPMASFNHLETAFKDAKGQKQNIAFQSIKSVTYGDVVLIPGKVNVNGKMQNAYLEVLENGSATLYKAFFYGSKTMGKNNATTAFQWSYVVETPLNGMMALGTKPSLKQVETALKHPVISVAMEHHTSPDEAAMIRFIQMYNTAVSENISK